MVARSGERVRIRIGNLSMHEHPVHLHGTQFHVTGGDGGRWPEERWRTEGTELVGVGQMRDIEFLVIAGDWAFHCHKSHHTMNAMGLGIPNVLGVDQSSIDKEIRKVLPSYMAMGRNGMSEHSMHLAMGMLDGSPNTLPMVAGEGPFGPVEMGGMFTVLKVRDEHARGDYNDPGWYKNPPGTVASRARNALASVVGHDQVDATVLGHVGRRIVRHHRLRLAIASGGQTVCVDTLADQVVRYGLGTLLG